MERLDYLIDFKIDISTYFPNRKICFLDIETTGLSRKFNQIYLIGLVYLNDKDGGWYLSQFFANNIDEEGQLLEQLNKVILNFDLLITYNGDSFDIPFIKYRSNFHNVVDRISNIDSFDIYRNIRSHSSYLPFKDFKLKTIEESLNIYREDKHTGKDCINLYYKYLDSGDTILKKKILKHNFDDLYYLVDVIQIFDVIQDIKSVSIDLCNEIIPIQINNITTSGDIMQIISNTLVTKSEMNLVYFADSFNIIWQKNTQITLELDVKEGYITPTRKCLFVNKSKLPQSIDIKDMTDYMVPEDIIILKIDDKYQMDNLKNIIEQLILYVLNSQSL